MHHRCLELSHEAAHDPTIAACGGGVVSVLPANS